MRAAIITSSDSGYAGEREDRSGPLIRGILEALHYHTKLHYSQTSNYNSIRRVSNAHYSIVTPYFYLSLHI